MWKWSVVLSRGDSAEYETLRPEGIENDFCSKKNAQLFAESYILEYIWGVDGINRLEPYTTLPNSTSKMSGLEVTRDDISRIEKDETVSNLKCHYIVGNKRGEPWGLTVHRLHIFTRPMTITKIEEKMEEREVEEEQEIETDKQVVVPGRIFNSYRTEKVREKVKTKVKKQVPVQISTQVTAQERSTRSTDVFTLSLVRTKITDQVSPIEREQAILIANALAKSFSETNTFKTILAICETGISYKISELREYNTGEFGSYHPPEKKAKLDGVRISRPNKTPELSEGIPQRVNLRRATSTLGIKANIGAALACLGGDIMKRRQEMFKTLIPTQEEGKE
jgi:hypothetical protein